MGDGRVAGGGTQIPPPFSFLDHVNNQKPQRREAQNPTSLQPVVPVHQEVQTTNVEHQHWLLRATPTGQDSQDLGRVDDRLVRVQSPHVQNSYRPDTTFPGPYGLGHVGTDTVLIPGRAGPPDERPVRDMVQHLTTEEGESSYLSHQPTPVLV